MKKDIATRWVQALRSGEYKQATGSLVKALDDDNIGCLGVLCELAVQDGVIPLKNGNRDSLGFGFLGHNFFPPVQVLDWAGLLDVSDDRDEIFKVKLSDEIRDRVSEYYGVPNEDYGHLASLNDELEVPFDQIADMIENTYLKD